MKEKGVKIETVQYSKPVSVKMGKSKYKFGDMKVNQSFLLETEKRYSVATLAKRFGDAQSPKREFSVKQFEDGLRCVRTK